MGRAKRRNYAARKPKKASSITVMIGLCLVAVIGAIGALGLSNGWYKLDILAWFQDAQVQEDISLDNLPRAGRDMAFAGVQFGMSPAEVERMHPKLSIAQQIDGSTRMRYFQGDATFTIWFDEYRGKDQAYRMRFDKSFSGVTEDEVMAKISRSYGLPNATKCRRQQVPVVRTCSFKWIGKHGISVVFHLRTIRESRSTNQGERIELAMEVVDTLIEGKLIRNKQAGRRVLRKADPS